MSTTVPQPRFGSESAETGCGLPCNPLRSGTEEITDAITPLAGTTGIDKLNGGNTADIISGRQGADILAGNNGDDLVHGGSGGDLIQGGNGNDVLHGGGSPALLNMANFAITEDHTGRVTFITESAGYRNTLVKYSVAADGTMSNVVVLFANASAKGSGGDLTPGKSSVEVPLQAGERIGFMVLSNAYGQSTGSLLADPKGRFEVLNAAGKPASIHDTGNVTLWHVAPNGTRTAIKTQYGTDTYHSAATPKNGYALNPDNLGHTVGRVETEGGTIVLGFEDLQRGGDRDFDDIVFRFDIGQSNARVLDPNLDTTDGGEGTSWAYDAKGDRRTMKGVLIAPENDTVNGGSGDDIIHGGVDHDRLSGGEGNDVVNGDSGADILWGDAGADGLNGGTGNDTLFGDAGDDRLDGGSGADSLEGGAGDDQMTGGDGSDRLLGDAGQDSLSGGAGEDVLDGGEGDDVLDGGSGLDVLSGGVGNDNLNGGDGDDLADGGIGNDVVNGGAGADILNGDIGNDSLDGGSGNDQVFGGKGSDRLDGGSGDDTLDGGEGADVLSGAAGDDTLAGGPDNDELSGGSGNDAMAGDAGNDKLSGGEGNDILSGGTGDDRLEGGKGSDKLSGDAGNDRLSGGDGDDILQGGAGINVLTGGLGADCFEFTAADRAGSTNTITDFACGADEIDLSGLGFGPGFSAEAFRAGHVSATALGGVAIVYDALSITVENTMGMGNFIEQVWSGITFV